jgi:pilus assembly protein Flp/PilA
MRAQVSQKHGFYTSASKHVLSAPPPLEGRCTHMKLRDWFELVRIQLKREEGQTMAEYGLLLALIALACIVVLGTLGLGISGKFNQVVNGL